MIDLYAQIKALRTVEQRLSIYIKTAPQSYYDALMVQKVECMAKIGDLNRKIYSK